GMRKGPGIEVVADLPKKLPVCIEFQKLCRPGAISGAVSVPARENEDVPLGIDSYPGSLTEIKIRRQLQKIRNRVETKFRDWLLAKKPAGAKEQCDIQENDEAVHYGFNLVASPA